MFLIAPDKYRGTLTARQAVEAIAAALGGRHLVLPMADGGEGTADAVNRLTPGWEFISTGCYFNCVTREIVLDSSAVVGYGNYSDKLKPTERSSAQLGTRLNDLYAEFRPRHIYLGVGGTAMCDGGVGMLETLSRNVAWDVVLHGLIDVKVPLLPPYPGAPSSLMFCPQKGFNPTDIIEVERKLKSAVKRYGQSVSPFGGAGGGIGYALADVIGAPCSPGAEWIVERARIPWHDITHVFTGEGRFDEQSLQGKVVDTVYRTAREHGLPTTCVAGSRDFKYVLPPGLEVIDASDYLKGSELDETTAKNRIVLAVKDWMSRNMPG